MPDDFSDIADVFEAQVDWPKRLGHETPFFRWLFDRVKAASVLDAACGTGHHAHLFSTWNLGAQGADVSAEMIRRCRQKWGESSSLTWTVRGYDRPVEPSGRFDVAICTGNSLALAPDLATVELALSRLISAVRPGGAVMIHVPNLWKFPDGPVVWQKCVRTRLPAGDSLLIKGTHRCGSAGFVDFHVTNLDIMPPASRSQSVRFLGLEQATLEAAARAGGASQVEFFGDYLRAAYDRGTSPDLIMLATR